MGLINRSENWETMSLSKRVPDSSRLLSIKSKFSKERRVDFPAKILSKDTSILSLLVQFDSHHVTSRFYCDLPLSSLFLYSFSYFLSYTLSISLSFFLHLATLKVITVPHEEPRFRPLLPIEWKSILIEHVFIFTNRRKASQRTETIDHVKSQQRKDSLSIALKKKHTAGTVILGP